MQGVQRPEQGPRKRCQFILEKLTGDPVDNPDGQCVKDKLDQVIRKRIRTRRPADEPISENVKRPVEPGLRTAPRERPHASQKNPPPQVRILYERVFQDLLNIVRNKSAGQNSLVEDDRHQNQQPTAHGMMLLEQIIQTGQQCSTPLLTLRTHHQVVKTGCGLFFRSRGPHAHRLRLVARRIQRPRLRSISLQ